MTQPSLETYTIYVRDQFIFYEQEEQIITDNMLTAFCKSCARQFLLLTGLKTTLARVKALSTIASILTKRTNNEKDHHSNQR